MSKKEKEIIKMSQVLVEKHKHKIKLAFNDDEIISYCEECGKILDVYKKVKQCINVGWATTPIPTTTTISTLTGTTSEAGYVLQKESDKK